MLRSAQAVEMKNVRREGGVPHRGFAVMTTGGLMLTVLAMVAIPASYAAEPAKPAAATAAPAPAPNSTASCLECHSDPDLFLKRDGKKISLFLDDKIPAASAHTSLECI